jgi:hypothetical protein
MEMMTFNGRNVDEVKEFAGDACKIEPVYDNNGVVWGQSVEVNTKSCLIRLMPYDILTKEADDIHVYRISKH